MMRPSHPKLEIARHWWHLLLIPALRRHKQVDLGIQGQPGLQSE
ncbi:hypothetical protein U0070_025750, partial [Myodes glareolus]